MKKILFFIAFSFALSWQGKAQFTEDFEGTFLPTGWSKQVTSGNDITQSTTYNHTSSGSNSARFSSYSSATDYNQYLFTSAITVSAPNTELRFWHREYGSGDQLSWGVSTTTADSAQVGTLTALTQSTSAWKEEIIDLSSYVGQTIYFAFHYYGNYSYYAYLDDVTLGAPPSCPDPTALTVANLTTSSADLGWTENGTATAWEIEWGTAGFSQGSGTTVAASSNPHSLSGLTSNTVYEFYVRSGCGANDSSAWVGPFSFTTNCNAVSSFPYTENFDGSLNNGVWNCWSVVNNDNDAYTWSQSNTYISPTKSGLYAAHGMGNNDDYLISPQLTIGASAIRVKFWDKVESATRNNTYTVRVSTTGTNPADFTDSITTIDCSNTSWVEHVVNLSAYTNQSIYVAFHQTYSTSTSWGFGIDDFTAEVIPSCTEPDTLMASNETTVGADLYWTEMGTATTWDVEIVTTGTTPTGTATNAGLTSDSVTITGLNPATTYDYYVRANCGGTTSPWVGPYTFSTSCPSSFSLPWSEGFENGGTIPNCWSMSGGENWLFNTSGPNHVGNAGTITGSTVTNSYYAVVDASGSDSAATLTSPFVDISSLTNPQLSFYEISDNEGFANSVLDVEVWDGSAWNNVGTYNSNTNGWEEKEIVLSALTFTGPAAVRFIFSETVPTDYYDDIAIDDVTFEEAPTCPKPSNLMAGSITPTSANLSWTESGSATTWDIEWDTAGFTMTGTPNITGTTTNPHALTGLNPNTMYEFYVRSSCSSTDSSVWVGPFSFTTPCNPYAVPFNEGFESGYTDQAYLAGCLSQESVAGLQNWVANSTQTTYNRGARTGSYNATLRYSNEDWIFIPVNLVAGTSYTASVYARQDGSGTTNASVMIAYGSSNTAASMSDTVVGPIGIDDNYQLISGDFAPATTGLYYVGIKGEMNSSPWYISIDDIEIKQTPVSVSVVVDNHVSCLGGTNGGATASNVGGVSPFTYVWSNAAITSSVTGLPTGTYSVTVTDGNGDTDTASVTINDGLALTVNLGNDTNLCEGATYSLDAGTGSTYIWSTGATTQTISAPTTALGTTNYSVTVTNSTGCVDSSAIDVTVVVSPSVSLGNDTAVCDGVTLTLDAGSYTSYLWDDASTMQTRTTVSSTGNMDYSVEVTDANGCTARDTITVMGYSTVMVDLGNDTSLCDGETLDLDPGSFASYVWSNASVNQVNTTVSTLGAVSYSVEVTDTNGCTGNDTIEVTGLAPVTVSLGPDTLICYDASYTLDAGSGFSSYFWNNGFNTQTLDINTTNSGTFTYSVNVEGANGCTGTDEAIITVNPEVMVDLGPDTNIWQTGVTEITLDAGAGFASYLWSDFVTTTQTYVVRPSNSGTISVAVEDGFGCNGADTIEVNFVTGINEFSASSLKLYPNPAVDQVSVDFTNMGNANNVEVTFMTISGKVVLSERVNVTGDSFTQTFDVSSLATGSYMVSFKANDEVIVRQFIIK